MENSKFHDIVQVAVVVKDIQAAIDRYESIYGIGPWGTMHLTKETALHLIDNGRTVPDEEDFHVILAATRVGGVELELIQPVTPNSIYYSFLQEHGEGFHHVAITQDASFAQLMEERGDKQLASATLGHTDCVYYDTRKDLGFIVETYQEAKTDPS